MRRMCSETRLRCRNYSVPFFLLFTWFIFAGVSIAFADSPDLTMTIVSGPTSGVTGGTITVSNTVRNQGTGGTGNFWVSLYLSADSTITTGDILLGEWIKGALAPGAESAASNQIWLPANLTPGTYYLGAIADL